MSSNLHNQTYHTSQAKRIVKITNVRPLSGSGGSHFMLLDEISQKLHQHGHEVRMLLHLGNPVITGTHAEERHLS